MDNILDAAINASAEMDKVSQRKELVQNIIDADDITQKQIAFMLKKDVFGTGPRNASELSQAIEALYGIKFSTKVSEDKWTPPFEWLHAMYFDTYPQLLGVAPRGSGKCLWEETEIPTPTGWKKMRDIQVGDDVFGDDGKPTRVITVSDVMVGHKCYRVTFTDGSTVITNGEHLWETEDRRYRDRVRQLRRYKSSVWSDGVPKDVYTTEEIRQTLTVTAGKVRTDLNHAVAMTRAVEYPEQNLPIDPYIFGIWLGDGASAGYTITSADEEILDRIRAKYPVNYSSQYDYSIPGLSRDLRPLGVLNNKHIPEIYLQSSVEQRLELLRGLMDSDGTANKAGSCVIGFSLYPQLTKDTAELIHSLGMKTQYREKIPTIKGVAYKLHRMLSFTPLEHEVFYLKRKLDRQKANKGGPYNKRTRFIESVEEVESVPVKCIGVDNQSHLYLCTRSFIPTHNTLGASVITHFKCHHKPGYEATHLGARLEQAQVAQRYLANFQNDSILNEGMESIGLKKAKWNNGSLWMIVAGTMAGVSGQHPSMLSIDELEFLDVETLEQTWANPMDKNGYRRFWTGFSTRQRASSLMNILTQQAESGEKNIKLMQWSVFEVMRPCRECLCIKGGNVISEPEKTCPLWKYCIEGNQFIQTVNRGPIPINQLRVGDVVYTWNDGSLGQKAVKKVWSNGLKPTLNIQTSLHKSLCLTAEHPVLVVTSKNKETLYSWKEAGTLELGDIVVTLKQTSRIGNTLDNDLLWLIGVYLGDGSQSKYKINISEFDSELQQRIIRIAAERWNASCSINNNGVWIYSKQAVDEFRGLGIEPKRSYTKTLPEWTGGLNKSQFDSLFAGYVSADGQESAHRNGFIRLDSTSHTLLRQFRNLLASHGYTNIGSINETKRSGKPLIIKGVQVKVVRPIYHMEVRLTSNRFGKELYAKHTELLANTNFRLEKIIKITPGEEAEVFDMTVEDDHNFIAEGMVVHNCHGEKARKVDGWMSRESVVNLMETMTQESFETQMLCLRPSSHGLVLSTFIADYATKLDINRGNYLNWTYQNSLPLYCWHDPADGGKSALCFVQIFGGKVFLFDELIMDGGPTIEKVKVALWEHCTAKGYSLPKFIVMDPHRAEVYGKIWQEGSPVGEGKDRSYMVEYPNMDGTGFADIEPGLELTRALICNGIGARTFFVNPIQAKGYVTAITNNRYKVDKTNIIFQGAKQELKYKDEIDSIRYGLIHAVQRLGIAANRRLGVYF